jgi:hypothetical protein
VPKDIFDDAAELLTWLEKRKLSEREACAVLGIALQSIIADPTEAQHFIRFLERQMLKKDTHCTTTH